MEETDRDKLVKVLRMFGSDHDGEVAAAARRAHSIMVTHSLDWDDLIVRPGQRAQAKPRSGKPTQAPASDADEIDMIRRCMTLPTCLTAWENNFIGSISESIVEWGSLTPKQRAILDRIVNGLKLKGVWDYDE